MESKSTPKCECDLEPVFPGYEYRRSGEWFCMRCGKPEDKVRVEKWAEGVRATEDPSRPFTPTREDWEELRAWMLSNCDYALGARLMGKVQEIEGRNR